MDFSNLSEGLVNYHANHEQPSKDFTDADVRVTTHPKTKETIERILKTSTNYNFNILILPKNIDAKSYCTQNKIPLENHITYVKISSSGDPLTPWMIFHTLGHALIGGTEDYSGGPTDTSTTIKQLLTRIEELNPVKTVEIDTFPTISKVFKFSSAVNNKITNLWEFIYELVAEYLWHGKIRYNAPQGFYQPALQSNVTQIGQAINYALSKVVGKIIIDK